ncbi:restriction endonuclease [Candidatus Solirubrobacter pratensis]|uniref:restriction endonuclease n=1 Tax=Candidatus Solirubrobacter pratensis TaxID=1298857 RepID=UPI001E41C630
MLGLQDVRHDVVERPAGRAAAHQLDVTARDQEGRISRVVIECKDWDKKVGKGVLDALVGVRLQISATEAAVMTTAEFTRGARMVAADESIALLRLRSYDEARDGSGFIRSIHLTLDAYASHRSDFGVEPAPDHGFPPGDVRIGMGAEDRFQRLDGRPAETLKEVLQANGAPRVDGVYQQRAEFDGGRLMSTADGRQLPIKALTWTETVGHSTSTTVSRMQGEPVLVVEQFDVAGNVADGRLVVDRDLYAWEIRPDGHVVARGDLDASVVP